MQYAAARPIGARVPAGGKQFDCGHMYPSPEICLIDSNFPYNFYAAANDTP